MKWFWLLQEKSSIYFSGRDIMNIVHSDLNTPSIFRTILCSICCCSHPHEASEPQQSWRFSVNCSVLLQFHISHLLWSHTDRKLKSRRRTFIHWCVQVHLYKASIVKVTDLNKVAAGVITSCCKQHRQSLKNPEGKYLTVIKYKQWKIKTKWQYRTIPGSAALGLLHLTSFWKHFSFNF